MTCLRASSALRRATLNSPFGPVLSMAGHSQLDSLPTTDRVQLDEGRITSDRVKAAGRFALTFTPSIHTLKVKSVIVQQNIALLLLWLPNLSCFEDAPEELQ